MRKCKKGSFFSPRTGKQLDWKPGARFAQNGDIVSWNPPLGGLLAMMKYKASLPSAGRANSLAEDYSVMLAPGSACGYEGYLRIGIGNTPHLFKEGLEQTAKALRELG